MIYKKRYKRCYTYFWIDSEVQAAEFCAASCWLTVLYAHAGQATTVADNAG